MLPYFGVLAAVTTKLLSPNSLSTSTVTTHSLEADRDRPQHRVAAQSEDEIIQIRKFNEIKHLTSVASFPEGMLATQKEGKLYFINKDKTSRVVKNYAEELGDKFTSEKECGLLSVAYDEKHHPTEVFITYTVKSKDKHATNDMFVVRHGLTFEGEEMKLSEVAQVIFTQPFVEYIHHAGTLVFDDRGRLYLSVGDGGPQGDPEGHGQSLDSYRGKLLRIYPNETPDIIVYGLRNPWKYSIVHNAAYIGNVGHGTTESIVYIPSLDENIPYNAGWNLYEGSLPYKNAPRKPTAEEAKTIIPPIFEYPTDANSETTPGRAVLGGYIVPGRPNLYVFSDHISGYVYVLRRSSQNDWWQIAKKKLPDGSNPYSLGLAHNTLFALTTKGVYMIQIE